MRLHETCSVQRCKNARAFPFPVASSWRGAPDTACRSRRVCARHAHSGVRASRGAAAARRRCQLQPRQARFCAARCACVHDTPPRDTPSSALSRQACARRRPSAGAGCALRARLHPAPCSWPAGARRVAAPVSRSGPWDADEDEDDDGEEVDYSPWGEARRRGRPSARAHSRRSRADAASATGCRMSTSCTTTPCRTPSLLTRRSGACADAAGARCPGQLPRRRSFTFVRCCHPAVSHAPPRCSVKLRVTPEKLEKAARRARRDFVCASRPPSTRVYSLAAYRLRLVVAAVHFRHPRALTRVRCALHASADEHTLSELCIELVKLQEFVKAKGEPAQLLPRAQRHCDAHASCPQASRWWFSSRAATPPARAASSAASRPPCRRASAASSRCRRPASARRRSGTSSATSRTCRAVRPSGAAFAPVLRLL